MCKVWGMFINEGTGVCAANPPKLKRIRMIQRGNEWEQKKVFQKWKMQKGKCTTTSDSFPQMCSEQPDYTFENWAHVTLKNHYPDWASQVFKRRNTVKFTMGP